MIDEIATPSEVPLFVYGTLMDGGSATRLLDRCRRIASGSVQGTLYAIDDRYPALLLGGTGTVHGEIWLCPVDRLRTLDRYEGVAERLFRRVAVRVGDRACWTYIAGPALGPRLKPERRVRGGRWRAPIADGDGA